MGDTEFLTYVAVQLYQVWYDNIAPIKFIPIKWQMYSHAAHVPLGNQHCKGSHVTAENWKWNMGHNNELWLVSLRIQTYNWNTGSSKRVTNFTKQAQSQKFIKIWNI